jgi:hypothetical protein
MYIVRPRHGGRNNQRIKPAFGRRPKSRQPVEHGGDAALAPGFASHAFAWFATSPRRPHPIGQPRSDFVCVFILSQLLLENNLKMVFILTNYPVIFYSY